ncbi:MAG: stage V sporulation protein AE [Firmicutes bacterium]|nr:stage V sporulation protein AE [Bacillota bacterium]
MDVGKKVIVVTDGDRVARRAVETASRNIGARCISCSAGNPTPLDGPALVEMIKKAPRDPVVVMLDDRGCRGTGRGEAALRYLCGHPEVEVLGVLAVASNTENVNGCTVDASIARNGLLVDGPVDKHGRRECFDSLQRGDTVEMIDSLNLPLVIGIGDIGKMDGADEVGKGAPLTTRALRIILERSGLVAG